MKNILTILLALCVSFAAFASQNNKTPQEKYIEKYAPLAVSEMYRSGVPASITLAQGMLESAAGQSILASKGNNHFGIKATKDWLRAGGSYLGFITGNLINMKIPCAMNARDMVDAKTGTPENEIISLFNQCYGRG